MSDFVLVECLDRLGKRSDRLWSAWIIFAKCLADPQCFSGVLWDPAFFIHHLFEVVYFQKPFACALHFRLSFYMIRNLYLTQMR